jgi:hypothetical protein
MNLKIVFRTFSGRTTLKGLGVKRYLLMKPIKGSNN